MGVKPPRVDLVRTYGVDRTWRGELDLPDGVQPSIRVESLAWFAWLAASSTTSFAYPILDPVKGYLVGTMTVRKERRQRGGTYWVAYRRCQGRVRKIYVGAGARLTQQELDRLAAQFLAAQGGGMGCEQTEDDS